VIVARNNHRFDVSRTFYQYATPPRRQPRDPSLPLPERLFPPVSFSPPPNAASVLRPGTLFSRRRRPPLTTGNWVTGIAALFSFYPLPLIQDTQFSIFCCPCLSPQVVSFCKEGKSVLFLAPLFLSPVAPSSGGTNLEPRPPISPPLLRRLNLPSLPFLELLLTQAHTNRRSELRLFFWGLGLPDHLFFLLLSLFEDSAIMLPSLFLRVLRALSARSA